MKMRYPEARELALELISKQAGGVSYDDAMDDLRRHGEPLTPEERQQVIEAVSVLETHITMQVAGFL